MGAVEHAQAQQLPAHLEHPQAVGAAAGVSGGPLAELVTEDDIEIAVAAVEQL